MVIAQTMLLLHTVKEFTLANEDLLDNLGPRGYLFASVQSVRALVVADRSRRLDVNFDQLAVSSLLSACTRCLEKKWAFVTRQIVDLVC